MEYGAQYNHTVATLLVGCQARPLLSLVSHDSPRISDSSSNGREED
jgi:hypothetical protein